MAVAAPPLACRSIWRACCRDWPVKFSGQGNNDPVEDAVAFTLTIHNVDTTAIFADSSLQAKVEKVIRQVVSSRPGIGIAPESVKLVAGPLIMQCIVTFPHGISATDVQLRLDASATLSHNVAAGLSILGGMDAVCFGPVSVCHIGEAMAVILASFQGTWKKHLSTYIIKGTTLRFPSSASTEIKTTSPTTFSITSPSGVELNAHLVANGQQLHWSNGSVWHRVAPQHTFSTLHALQNTLRETVVDSSFSTLERVHAEQEQIYARREERMNKHQVGALPNLEQSVVDISDVFKTERINVSGSGRTWLPCCRCNTHVDRSSEVEEMRKSPIPQHSEREEELVDEAAAKWPAARLQLGRDNYDTERSYKAMSAYSYSGHTHSTVRTSTRGGA